MDVKILFVDIECKFDKYEKYLNLISNERVEKIKKFKFDKDKIISFFTELLMRNEISTSLNINFNEIVFAYGKYGKPYLPNVSGFYFSVSHSGNCIVFVSSHKEIGIDVEKIIAADFMVSQSFFTSN
jgi:4'-phosphopantetheinyl transferase